MASERRDNFSERFELKESLKYLKRKIAPTEDDLQYQDEIVLPEGFNHLDDNLIEELDRFCKSGLSGEFDNLPPSLYEPMVNFFDKLRTIIPNPSGLMKSDYNNLIDEVNKSADKIKSVVSLCRSLSIGQGKGKDEIAKKDLLKAFRFIGLDIVEGENGVYEEGTTGVYPEKLIENGEEKAFMPISIEHA